MSLLQKLTRQRTDLSELKSKISILEERVNELEREAGGFKGSNKLQWIRILALRAKSNTPTHTLLPSDSSAKPASDETSSPASSEDSDGSSDEGAGCTEKA